MIQSCADASPVKWHQAHTTWFFETFVLRPFLQELFRLWFGCGLFLLVLHGGDGVVVQVDAGGLHVLHHDGAIFLCQSCGAAYNRWQGKCDSCGEWNTLAEEDVTGATTMPVSIRSRRKPRTATTRGSRGSCSTAAFRRAPATASCATGARPVKSAAARLRRRPETRASRPNRAH